MIEMMIEEEQEETTERAPFCVADDQRAEWCLNKIREKKQELEKWKAHYAAQLEAVKKSIEGDIAYFENSLEQYFRMQQAEGNTRAAEKSISYKLPSGKLVLKKQEPEFEFDKDKLLDWLENNDPEYIKVERSPRWGELKKKLTIDGTSMITEDAEVVPGITVVPRDEIFKVEVAK
jgi:hypothetical protein